MEEEEGEGEKCLGVLGNDGIADKIEKSRRGNGLDGKRRGPAVSVLSNTFQEDFRSAGTVIHLEIEDWVSGEGPGLGVVVCSGTEAARALRWPGHAHTGGDEGLAGTLGKARRGQVGGDEGPKQEGIISQGGISQDRIRGLRGSPVGG